MTRITYRQVSLALLTSLMVMAGCTGSRTFHDYARAGDTIAVGAGWTHQMDRGNIQVTITDADENATTYPPGHPAVRGSINFYPDPVSGLVLSDRLDTDVTPAAFTYAGLINSESTGNDRDWWETVIFIDLPAPMALGDATVDIVDVVSPAMESTSSVVTIVPDETGDVTGIGTGGTANSFTASLNGNFPFDMADSHFLALERVDHFVVSFSGDTVPHAIQVDLRHDPDDAHGGSGTPYVVNPVGHIKNLSWAQTGTSGTDLRVIMTPARDGEIRTMHDYKFYVAGGVGNLALNGTVQAFDSSGAPITDVVNVQVASGN